MMARLRHVFDVLRARHGEWDLFAVLYRGRREPSPWDIVVAAPWLDEARRLQNRAEILDALAEVSTLREMTEMGIAVMLTDPAEVAAAIRKLLNGRPIDHPVGLVRRKNFDFHGLSFKRGYVWAANPPVPAASPAA